MLRRPPPVMGDRGGDGDEPRARPYTVGTTGPVQGSQSHTEPTHRGSETQSPWMDRRLRCVWLSNVRPWWCRRKKAGGGVAQSGRTWAGRVRRGKLLYVRKYQDHLRLLPQLSLPPLARGPRFLPRHHKQRPREKERRLVGVAIWSYRHGPAMDGTATAPRIGAGPAAMASPITLLRSSRPRAHALALPSQPGAARWLAGRLPVCRPACRLGSPFRLGSTTAARSLAAAG